MLYKRRLTYTYIFFSDEPTLERIKNILMVMEQKMELRGSAGELLRSAVTPYIQNLSESHFPCHNDKIVDLWKMIIGKNTQVLFCGNTPFEIPKKFPKNSQKILESEPPGLP